MFELYRHKKTGGLYVMIAQEAIDEKLGPETDKDFLRVVYASVDDGRIWVRSTKQFFDGRFERVTKQKQHRCSSRARYNTRFSRLLCCTL